MTPARSTTLPALLADAVLVLHVLVVVFAVGGAFLMIVDPLYAALHVPLVAWVGYVNLTRGTCPLTPLEQRLRAMAGERSYSTTWTRRYLQPIVRPVGLPRRLELVAGVSILVWNAIVYAALLYLRQS